MKLLGRIFGRRPAEPRPIATHIHCCPSCGQDYERPFDRCYHCRHNLILCYECARKDLVLVEDPETHEYSVQMRSEYVPPKSGYHHMEENLDEAENEATAVPRTLDRLAVEQRRDDRPALSPGSETAAETLPPRPTRAPKLRGQTYLPGF